MTANEPDLSPAKLKALRAHAAREEELDKAVLDEIAELDEQHRLYVFRPETRCRVCVSEANGVVNTMLSHAMTYTDILRALEPMNRLLPKKEQVTYNSLWTHAKKHFPIEKAASAVYRRMVEKRAEEFGVDFVRGVSGALTPMAYLDVVQQKGFETLVSEDTVVSVETGMRAAEKLLQLTRDNDSTDDVADAMLRLHKVVEAVKETVPEDLWPTILAKIEGGQDSNVIDADTVELADVLDPDEDETALDPDDPDFDLEGEAGSVLDDEDNDGD